MNPDMTTKLNRIKSALRESIEIARKASREPWINDGPSVRYGYKGRDLVTICSLTYKDREEYDNATFIAHARTMTPIACKALLTAIEGLEQIAGYSNQPPTHIDGICPYGCDTPEIAAKALEFITSTWPDA